MSAPLWQATPTESSLSICSCLLHCNDQHSEKNSVMVDLESRSRPNHTVQTVLYNQRHAEYQQLFTPRTVRRGLSARSTELVCEWTMRLRRQSEQATAGPGSLTGNQTAVSLYSVHPARGPYSGHAALARHDYYHNDSHPTDRTTTITALTSSPHSLWLLQPQSAQTSSLFKQPTL